MPESDLRLAVCISPQGRLFLEISEDIRDARNEILGKLDLLPNSDFGGNGAGLALSIHEPPVR